MDSRFFHLERSPSDVSGFPSWSTLQVQKKKKKVLLLLLISLGNAAGAFGVNTTFTGNAVTATLEEDSFNYVELPAPILARADLRITKSGTQLIAAGDPDGGFYLMKIVNGGPSWAFNVRMVDFDIPQEFFVYAYQIFFEGSIVEGGPAASCTIHTPHNVSCFLGQLQAITGDTQVSLLFYCYFLF